MTIRTMGIRDYDGARAVWLATSGMGLNSLDDSPQGIGRYLDRNPGTCFVAERGGRIIGVILCGHDGRRGFIYHLAVLAAERGQGIGSALLNAALAALRAEGIHKVALVAFRANETGNHFWERRGFGERQDLTYRNKTLTASERLDT